MERPTIKGAILAALAVLGLAALGGCYPHDCKPGDACWQNCADNPSMPGCVGPWDPDPIGAHAHGGAPGGRR